MDGLEEVRRNDRAGTDIRIIVNAAMIYRPAQCLVDWTVERMERESRVVQVVAAQIDQIWYVW